jgi:hypothetical protein
MILEGGEGRRFRITLLPQRPDENGEDALRDADDGADGE